MITLPRLFASSAEFHQKQTSEIWFRFQNLPLPSQYSRFSHTFGRYFAYILRSAKKNSVFHAGVRQIAECPAELSAQIRLNYHSKEPQRPSAQHTDRSETGSDPYLSTPDELEGDSMRVRKMKSRLITLETLGTCLASGMDDFEDFAPTAPHQAKPSFTLI